MGVPTFQEVHLRNFLSFGPKAPAVKLQALNVLIGPNGSGKSNFIEAFELMKAASSDLAGFVRQGGGAAELSWKGSNGSATSWQPASVSALLTQPVWGDLRYRLDFSEVAQRLEVVDETFEETLPRLPGMLPVRFYFRDENGLPTLLTRAFEHPRAPSPSFVGRTLGRADLDPQQSVLSQRKDPDAYPELTRLGETFARTLTFREWTFGRGVALRQPQPADLPNDQLLPDIRNLGLVLNAIEHSNRWDELNEHLRRFLPRFQRLSTRVLASHVQIYLHEDGLRTPIPATRLSDGTIRFIALLAILLRPEAPLVCLEEPELGLHPDAVGLIASLLIEASQSTQLVVTTHSDALVSALSENVESVLVAEQLAEGTTLTRLDSGRLQSWLSRYRLGEIWRMGELGGNP